ncbi:hypothetical protein AVEN_174414-1 [Araneus ventricosus]|uniref:Uncharacterized protein n=1 Tax=Araneus ventricosus TaxID=182803 RepID=A0A4Y2GZF0_ARAVE|nr:hypothetical protein AVEN_174414-1 [Araneus ventricosus]
MHQDRIHSESLVESGFESASPDNNLNKKLHIFSFCYLQAVNENSDGLDDELENNYARRSDITQWKLQRIITIRALKDLRKKLNIVCVGANCVKALGIGAILFGGVASIVGGVMVFRKSPSAVEAMNYGSLLYNSGAFVEALSKFIESFAPVYCLSEVEAILDKDKNLSQPQQQRLELPPRFDTKERLKKLFRNDLDSSVESEISAMIDSSRGFLATLNSMNEGQYPMFIGFDVKIQRLLEIFNKNNKSDIANKLGKSLTLVIVKEGANVYKSMFSKKASATESLPTNETSKVSANSDRMNAIQDVGNVKSASSNNAERPLESAVSANADGKNAIQDVGNVKSASSNNAERPLESTVSAFLTFQAIETVSSVFPLVSAAMVIVNGKSMYSDAIDDIIGPLERELRSTEELNLPP